MENNFDINEGSYHAIELMKRIREKYTKCELDYNYNTRAFWNYIWIKLPHEPIVRIDFPDSELYKIGFYEIAFKKIEEMRSNHVVTE